MTPKGLQAAGFNHLMKLDTVLECFYSFLLMFLAVYFGVPYLEANIKDAAFQMMFIFTDRITEEG